MRKKLYPFLKKAEKNTVFSLVGIKKGSVFLSGKKPEQLKRL
jgi:hypothetical protein